jgi:hypothetical protein
MKAQEPRAFLGARTQFSCIGHRTQEQSSQLFEGYVGTFFHVRGATMRLSICLAHASQILGNCIPWHDVLETPCCLS